MTWCSGGGAGGDQDGEGEKPIAGLSLSAWWQYADNEQPARCKPFGDSLKVPYRSGCGPRGKVMNEGREPRAIAFGVVALREGGVRARECWHGPGQDAAH